MRHRATVFFACRKYLLRSLYSNLQDLSAVEMPSSSVMAMHEPLPSPITQAERQKPQRKTDSIYSTFSSNIFAGCFSESCMLFILLLLQGSNIFSSRTRLLNWHFSMFLLLTCILVLIPFLFSLLLTLGADSGLFSPHLRSTLPRIIFSIASIALYLFALSFIPLPATVTASASLTLMTATLTRLVVLGTIILGLLAGFGAISSIWNHLPFRNQDAHRPTPTEQDVAGAEYALSSVREDLQQRREETVRRTASQRTAGTWLSGVMTTFRGDEDAQELRGLETLEYEMRRRLDALRRRHAASKYASTVRGRFVTLGGWLFAAYCYGRVIATGVTLFLRQLLALDPAEAAAMTNYPDAATGAFATLLGWMPPAADVDLDAVARVMRHLSLVLVGAIIASSIRLVLRGVARALRVTSRNLGAALMLLMLAQLMVSLPIIYLLATIVQLRASFPPPPAEDLSADEPAPVNLFSTIPEFHNFGRLFDTAFFGSAIVSLAVRWAAHKVSGPKEN
ncbi:G protein-coupled receptor 89 [Mycena pura]|uniref:G protein-coupled receptor 89 n=1 Tax=Mycena pura TaxID=153505 RepID=A0AAD6YKK7_9AGAR|nr:G protein-coupled receptor 89 [Mycena pura]